MKNYIKLEDAVSQFEKMCDYKKCANVRGGMWCDICAIGLLISDLRNKPAEDVVSRDCYDRLLAENDELRKERPVRHGRWKKVRIAELLAVFACSACGWQTPDYGRYCPNCGAKMDGEDGDGDV